MRTKPRTGDTPHFEVTLYAAGAKSAAGKRKPMPMNVLLIVNRKQWTDAPQADG